MNPRLFEDLSDLPDATTETADKPAEIPAPTAHDEKQWLGQDLAAAEDAPIEEIAEESEEAEHAEETPRITDHPLLRIPLSIGNAFWVVVGLLALVFIVVGMVQFTMDAFLAGVLLGWLTVVLLLALVGLTAAIVAREIKSYRRLRQVEHLREIGDRCRSDPRDEEAETLLIGELSDLLDDLEENGSDETRVRVREARMASGPNAVAVEWMEALEECLLAPMDEEVSRAIEKEAFNVGVGTAISPYGFVDAAVVLWRNVRMVRRIAEIYQVRPGACGTWLIVKRAVAAVALADLAQEMSTAFLGAFRGIASLISPLGQGLTNATLTIRLGLLAQRECRPLTPPKEKQKSAAKVLSRTVLQQIKRILRSRPKAGGAAATGTQGTKETKGT